MIAPPWSGVGNTTLPAPLGLKLSGAIDLKLLPAATRWVDSSALKKKNNLSLTIRPPLFPPYWTTMFLGLSGVVWKTLRARSAELVSYTHPVPWYLLVPDLTTTFTAAPPAIPTSAVYELVTMLTSSIASRRGTSAGFAGSSPS